MTREIFLSNIESAAPRDSLWEGHRVGFRCFVYVYLHHVRGHAFPSPIRVEPASGTDVGSKKLTLCAAKRFLGT